MQFRGQSICFVGGLLLRANLPYLIPTSPAILERVDWGARNELDEPPLPRPARDEVAVALGKQPGIACVCIEDRLPMAPGERIFGRFPLLPTCLISGPESEACTLEMFIAFTPSRWQKTVGP